MARGLLKPLVRPYPRYPFSHGDDGLAALGLPPARRPEDKRFGPDLILEMAQNAGGELTIVALGPLTNLALALIKDPTLPKKVGRLVLIGGAYGFHSVGAERATGDNPASEWNIYVDPESAEIVFAAGFNLTALGLDVVTHPSIELSADQRTALGAANSPASDFLLDVVAFVERRGFKSYCGLVDSLAVAAVLDDTVVGVEKVGVAVETESRLSRGQTIVDRRENFRWRNLSTIEAARDVDAPKFLRRLLSALQSFART